MEVDLLGDLYDHSVDHEVRTVGRVVRRAVLGPHLVVDGVLGLFDMQLTGIAVGIFAAEVIDAVGDVAGLLNLGEEVAGTNGVQTACRQEVEVADVGGLSPVVHTPRG